MTDKVQDDLQLTEEELRVRNYRRQTVVAYRACLAYYFRSASGDSDRPI